MLEIFYSFLIACGILSGIFLVFYFIYLFFLNIEKYPVTTAILVLICAIMVFTFMVYHDRNCKHIITKIEQKG